ncbi:hypothetical protein GJAV_G00132380 [Gymnothorax javanicus]|nr:hypothetical protein GJAV_G00132380 [Gymnothorax javanicus]
MDDEDGRCLLDVICDPEALNDFLHGSETHGHVPEVQTSSQLPASVPVVGVPSGSVDLDFLEDTDILGGSPGGGGDGAVEPCDILQQSLAEANITEQSLQEAEAELDLGAFAGSFPGLTQVVQPLPDSTNAALGVGIGVGVGTPAQIFPGAVAGPMATPPGTTQDVIGPVLAHRGLHLQPQVVNKAISMQPFMQQVGLGNVTLQPISGLQALPNGGQSGHLGIGQIQVVGQPTVMTINQSGQPILTKTMGGYQLQQTGQETGAVGAQARLGASVLGSPGGGGLLIQGGKAPLGSPALNGAVVGVSSGSTSSSSSSSTLTSSGGLLGFGGVPLGPSSAPQQKTLAQTPLMQNVIIQRTPTPIQPKPPQGTVIQARPPTAPSLLNDGGKTLAPQQTQTSVSSSQNVAFLTGKPGGNVVLSTQTGPQGASFPQTLFKQQGPQGVTKPLSLHLLNQSGSIVIPPQTVLQGQNPQFLLPQLQAGGQILTQHPGGHIITSQGPGGQLIANQILTAAGQNLNLGQMLTPQGPSGTAQILSGHIQLQPGQIGHPALFQMPVSLGQTPAPTHTGTGPAQTVIQGMHVQNSLAMLGQVEGLGPSVSLPAPPPPQPVGGVPVSGTVQPAPLSEGAIMLGTAPDPAAHPTPTPSILTVQTASSVPTSSLSSTSPSSSSSSSITGIAPSVASSSHGKLLFPQASGMILSHESLQMFLQQEQRQTERASPSFDCAPASVIVCGSSTTAPSVEAWSGQSSAHPVDPPSEATVVYQIPGHQQQPKVLETSPSQPLVAQTVPTSLRQTDSPQTLQPSPLILSQQIQSPHHQRPPSEPPPQIQAQPQPQSQPLSQPPSRSGTPSSRSCTPSSILPPLLIIHNQIGGSPQHVPQALPQVLSNQSQLSQAQSRPRSQPDPPSSSSSSPKPPQALPTQFQFATPPPSNAKPSLPMLSLTPEQQQNLQLVNAQLQTLSANPQPSPQQKQLLDRLHQVQHSIILQAKQQAQAQLQTQNQSQLQPPVLLPTHFSSQQNPSTAQVVTSSAGVSTSLLHQTSVLVKTPATVSNEVKVFPGPPAVTAPSITAGIAPVSLTPSTQAKQGVISSAVVLPGAKGGVQVVNTGLSQMSTQQPPVPAPNTKTQTTTLKMPFSMKPSKEARMLEQLRKQQGSVLHPDYHSPFRSYGDALQRLIPYHLYQGTPSSPQDYDRVDAEFESVSSQLLKRSQAMVDKYRLLLFEESKRLGPSAEMVMIDRMFIQEEKSALSQDRVLAKERPDEYAALQITSGSTLCPLSTESSDVKPVASITGNLTAMPSPALAPIPPHFAPTKLVIKQGGGGASVSWSTSSTPILAARQLPAPPLTSDSAPFRRRAVGDENDDEDALPLRSSRPPMKTYEARQRIGLKLKIKQEAGLSKIVHNTALDPVHSQPQLQPQPQPPLLPLEQQQPESIAPAETVSRTPPHSGGSELLLAVPTVTMPPAPAQMNGTVEHHESDGAKRKPAPSTPPPITCRLPLRKTYRANVSPPIRPGVVGGGGGSIAHSHPPSRPPGPLQLSPSSPSRTMIASVKVENRGGKSHPQALMNVKAGSKASSSSPPGLIQELVEVEEAFCIIKKRRALPRPIEEVVVEAEPDDREEGVELKRVQGGKGGIKNKERSSRGPPSSVGSPCTWGDSLLPAKRRKSDSPDVDNASFSSGSPPPDDSLNEHLQSAIDSILNLQQGAAPSGGGKGPGPNVQRQAGGPVGPYRSAPPSGSIGEFSARGLNGKLVSRTHNR